MAILLLDNYDSFTYNLVDYFAQLGCDCVVARNDVAFSEIQGLNPAAIILSPGPEVPSKSGIMMKVIDHYHQQIPFLGVCLGHQAIGEYFGMELIKAKVPRHGKITRVKTFNDVLFRQIPDVFNVVQYNSLLLRRTENSKIRVIATSENDEIMAIKHAQLPLWGVQFHPEAALTEYGLPILKNWIDSNKLSF